MYKNSDQLFHKFLEDTAAYRCEYLKILFKKYVKPEQEKVDVIDMRSFQVFTVSNNFKKMRKKTFGSVSSYYCESAKKTTSYWKKKIISGKRASSRKYVKVNESYDGEFNYARSKRNLKYHNETRDESCSSDEESEITLPYERHFSHEDNSSLSALESESVISCEDTSSFSSDTTIVASERRQNIATENSKFLVPNDKKCSLRANNAQLLSNSEMTVLKLNHPKQVQVLVKNFSSLSDSKCDEIVYEKLGLCVSSISSTKNKKKSENPALSVCNLNSFAHYVSSIAATRPKFRFSDVGSGISSKFHQVPSVSNDKSLHPTVPKFKAGDSRVHRSKIYSQDLSTFSSKPLAHASSKTTVPPKFSDIASGNSSKIRQVSSVSNDKSLHATVTKIKANDIRVERSNIDSQDLSDFNGKSLTYASSKPTPPSKFRFNKSEMEKPKDSYQATVCNSKSLCVLSKDTLPSKTRFAEAGLGNHKSQTTSVLSPSRYSTRNSVEIDILMSKKVSDDKKTCKMESSLVRSTIPFRKSKSKDDFKKNYEYLDKDCVPIDDLSLKSFHAKKKKKITRQKNN